MHQIDECGKEFDKKVDPDKSVDLYRTMAQENEDDGANALRRELMDLRYTDTRDSSRKIDTFPWDMVILPGFVRSIFFTKARGVREIKEIIRDLGLTNAREWDETKRAAAYWEFRNAATRYLTTCEGPDYAKKLFGTMQSTDEEKLTKTTRDFYSMTVLVPAKFGKEIEMELFTSAVRDAFFSYYPDAASAWRAAETGQNSKGFWNF